MIERKAEIHFDDMGEMYGDRYCVMVHSYLIYILGSCALEHESMEVFPQYRRIISKKGV